MLQTTLGLPPRAEAESQQLWRPVPAPGGTTCSTQLQKPGEGTRLPVLAKAASVEWGRERPVPKVSLQFSNGWTWTPKQAVPTEHPAFLFPGEQRNGDDLPKLSHVMPQKVCWCCSKSGSGWLQKVLPSFCSLGFAFLFGFPSYFFFILG